MLRHTFKDTVLSLLDSNTAPGLTAARFDMKSDTVNLPPNLSDYGLDSDGCVVGLGDIQLWPRQLLTAIHPQPHPHKFPQQ